MGDSKTAANVIDFREKVIEKLNRELAPADFLVRFGDHERILSGTLLSNQGFSMTNEDLAVLRPGDKREFACASTPEDIWFYSREGLSFGVEVEIIKRV